MFPVGDREENVRRTRGEREENVTGRTVAGRSRKGRKVKEMKEREERKGRKERRERRSGDRTVGKRATRLHRARLEHA